MTDWTVKAVFEASAAEVDSIFINFKNLHIIYSDSINNLEKQLDTLPNTYYTKIENAKKAFESMSKTVASKQKSISSQLYSQGITLLMGNAESILRDTFRYLVIDNFRKIKLEKSNVEFTLKEVIESKGDIQLGLKLFEKLDNDKNPSEKLSFQNMKQMQGILYGYFGIKISDEYTKALHEYWQIRHIIIHNQSYIDEKFIKNLKAVEIDTTHYKLGTQVVVTRDDYEECFGLLVMMLEELDHEIDRLKLKYEPLPF